MIIDEGELMQGDADRLDLQVGYEQDQKRLLSERMHDVEPPKEFKDAKWLLEQRHAFGIRYSKRYPVNGKKECERRLRQMERDKRKTKGGNIETD